MLMVSSWLLLGQNVTNGLVFSLSMVARLIFLSAFVDFDLLLMKLRVKKKFLATFLLVYFCFGALVDDGEMKYTSVSFSAADWISFSIKNKCQFGKNTILKLSSFLVSIIPSHQYFPVDFVLLHFKARSGQTRIKFWWNHRKIFIC